jgi:hypothetical protein
MVCLGFKDHSKEKEDKMKNEKKMHPEIYNQTFPG